MSHGNQKLFYKIINLSSPQIYRGFDGVNMKLEELFSVIKQRKKEMPEGSYTASLFKKGEDGILQKIGEEAVEVILAGKGRNKKRLVSEIADLWFHIMVLMAKYEISLGDISQELRIREKVSVPEKD